MTPLDDNSLLEQLRDRSVRDAAFKVLMDRYGQRLYWHIRRVVVSHEDAEDVFQDTCIKTYSGLDSFKGNGGQLLPWLYRIATNESLMHLRRRVSIFRSIESLSPQLVNTLRAENPQAAGKAEMLLAEAVLQLPVTQRLVFNMRYYDDMPYDDIARATGKTVGTLKTSYHYATNRIKEYIEQHAH